MNKILVLKLIQNCYKFIKFFGMFSLCFPNFLCSVGMSSALFDVSLGFCINVCVLPSMVHVNSFSVLYNSDICSCHLWLYTSISYLLNVDCVQCCSQCSHILPSNCKKLIRTTFQILGCYQYCSCEIIFAY